MVYQLDQGAAARLAEDASNHGSPVLQCVGAPLCSAPGSVHSADDSDGYLPRCSARQPLQLHPPVADERCLGHSRLAFLAESGSCLLVLSVLERQPASLAHSKCRSSFPGASLAMRPARVAETWRNVDFVFPICTHGRRLTTVVPAACTPAARLTHGAPPPGSRPSWSSGLGDLATRAHLM